MAKRATQVIPTKLKLYLEHKGYSKAAVARNANIKPDDFYAMLDNGRIMTADEFVSVCRAINTNATEIFDYVPPDTA